LVLLFWWRLWPVGALPGLQTQSTKTRTFELQHLWKCRNLAWNWIVRFYKSLSCK